MKKVFAIILTIVLVMGLSIPAFAAKSPGGTVYHKVVVVDGNDHKDAPAGSTPENITHKTVVEGDKVKVTATEGKGTFDNWVIYKADGTPAVAGEDYRLLGAFALTDPEIELIPLTTIVITANYDNIKTETIIISDEDESPETGDNTVVVLSAVALFALCGIVVAKKKLAK
jgi:hypothetical protein